MRPPWADRCRTTASGFSPRFARRSRWNSAATVGTNIAYQRRNEEQRYEGKLTYTPKSGHSLQGSYFKLNQTLFNSTGSQVADLSSLTPQGQPQSMISTQYTGVLTPNFSLTAHYAARKFALTNVGADKTDRIFGTLVLDLQRGWRYWSPTFCSGSACGDGDEQRNNENFIVKGSYFLSNNAYGTHHLVFGYDYFNDNIIANTHASGSDYRIRGTSSIVPGTQIFPCSFPRADTLDHNPLVGLSEGSNLRVHSLFANDNWRLNGRRDAERGAPPGQERCDRRRRRQRRQRSLAEPARVGDVGPERRGRGR